MAASTHRKQQIVAGHVARQAADRCHPEDMNITQLQAEVEQALVRFRASSIGAGHIDNAALAARAIECVREMWARGTQLHLDF